MASNDIFTGSTLLDTPSRVLPIQLFYNVTKRRGLGPNCNGGTTKVWSRKGWIVVNPFVLLGFGPISRGSCPTLWDLSLVGGVLVLFCGVSVLLSGVSSMC